jgi:very-short-patch-repair endonuclease/biotin operon repressor
MSPEEIQIAKELYESGESLRSISKQMGFSRNNIKEKLIREGVVISGARVLIPQEIKKQIIPLYNEYHSIFVVAEKLNISHVSVWRYLTNNGITMELSGGPRPKELRNGEKLKRTYTVKSCGNAHQWCEICAPATAARRQQKSKETLAAQGKTGPRSGQKMSEQQRADHKARRQWENMTPALREQFVQQFRGKALKTHSFTRPHRKLAELLSNAGYKVVNEHPVGKYSVDCFVPDLNMAFEADGTYWHSDPAQQAYDKARDEWLITEGGLTAVVRLSEEEINTWS